MAERDVVIEFVFDWAGPQAVARAYRVLVPDRRGRIEQRSAMTTAAIYSRVSSARQRDEAAMREGTGRVIALTHRPGGEGAIVIKTVGSVVH